MQAEAGGATLEAVADDDGVLARRQEDTLLEPHALDFEVPHGQAQLEPKLSESRRARAAELELAPVGQHDPFGELVEHHGAAQRVPERRDQQAVEASRDDAGDRARGIAADAVADDPFAALEHARRRRAAQIAREHARARGRHTASSSARAGTMKTAASPGRKRAWSTATSRTPSPP